MPAPHPAAGEWRSRNRKGRSSAGARSFRHRLEYVGVRVLALPLRGLPIDWTSAAFAHAFAAIMPRTSRQRRVLDHLSFALPKLSAGEREAIARDMWRNLGRVAAEAFQIDKILDDDRRISLPADFEHFEARAADGAIVATAHIGNWEIGGAVAKRGGLPFVGVYQKLHNPYVERYLKRLRAPAYSEGLLPKGPKLGQTLIRHARSGHGIGLVADAREFKGVPVTFFGQPSFGTPLPAMLARLTGRPLLAGCVVRTGGTRFQVRITEVAVPATDDRDADIVAATQSLHDEFERWIRDHPDQWLWTHRKWARPPADNRKSRKGSNTRSDNDLPLK